MGDASLKRTLPSQLNTSTKFLIQLAPLWGPLRDDWRPLANWFRSAANRSQTAVKPDLGWMPAESSFKAAGKGRGDIAA